MTTNPYTCAKFLKSAAQIKQLPPDSGFEVAFAGRSNAGKSSALNCLTQHSLARTSKTPGRTQLINLFELDDERRLVDLPGYGYAKVPEKVKLEWQKTLNLYLLKRNCLRGIIILMDCRHPLTDLDKTMIDWCLDRDLSAHLLLTKSDKLNRSEVKNTVLNIMRQYELHNELISVQAFSSLKKTGLSELITRINQWFEWHQDLQFAE